MSESQNERDLLILETYKPGETSIRDIEKILNISRTLIGKVLRKNHVVLGKKKLKFTQEHRDNIGKSIKGRMPWNKGYPRGEDFKRNSMESRLNGVIRSCDFDDYEKLKFLTTLFSGYTKNIKDRKHHTDLIYTFYNCNEFNRIYHTWIESGYNRWYRPSLDHKISVYNGGDFSVENLQFVTWFENHTKSYMNQDEWEKFRKDTNTKSDLFNPLPTTESME